MEPKNQIESELNSALRNIYFMRKPPLAPFRIVRAADFRQSSAQRNISTLLPDKLIAQFLTDEMRSHRVPHA
jgi:hypothetical protein